MSIPAMCATRTVKAGPYFLMMRPQTALIRTNDFDIRQCVSEVEP
jgi:hypothetical protein